MNNRQNVIKLYNVLFPLWMLMLFPTTWLIIVPGNFLIDSLVLLLGMACFKIEDKKSWYKRYILPVFGFGMLSDFIGTLYMLLLVLAFDVGTMGDEFYLTFPALLIAAGMIFVFNYFVTFRKADKTLRTKFALLFTVLTAPYTFLMPSSWLYS